MRSGLLFCMLLIGTWCFSGCSTYGDDVADLHNRIDPLEKQLIALQNVTEQVKKELIPALQEEAGRLTAGDKRMEELVGQLDTLVTRMEREEYITKDEAAATYDLLSDLDELKVLLGDIAALVESGSGAADLIAAVQQALAKIEEDCSVELAASVGDQIQSVTYLPGYTDGMATVDVTVDGGVYQEHAPAFTMEYEVRAKDEATSIALVSNLAASMKTSSPLVSLAVRGTEVLAVTDAVPVGNVLRLTIDASQLPQDFFNVEVKAPVYIALVVSGGKSGNFKTSYIGLRPSVWAVIE